jgi:hypothetical protein
VRSEHGHVAEAALEEALLVAAFHVHDQRRTARAVELLQEADLAGLQVGEIVSRVLRNAVAAAYEQGWQPLDLLHVARIELTRRIARLAADVIRAEAVLAGAAARAPADWVAQLASLEGSGPVRADDPVGGWREQEGAAAVDLWRDTIRLLAMLVQLMPLAALVERPSQWGGAGRRRVDESRVGDPKVLARIRALLAKAESTTFPEEAEALAAKAQELMTRYSVDAAVVGDDPATGASPGVRARRIRVDDPYARAKAQLFFGIASANGVKAVSHPDHRLLSAVGLPTDLDLAELLFTSLLVQAQRAMLLLAHSEPRARERSFRRGFLSAYAVRVGQRLLAARERAESDLAADRGGALVPVLARRREAVEQSYDELFPHTRRMRSSPVDAHGWRAGVAAADRADLGAAGRQERLTG